MFGEVSAASPHENTPRRPRGEGGYGSTALTAHTPERGGRAERRREMVGSGSEGGCGEGWCPSPPSPPSTTGAAPPRGELLPPRCLCHLLSASAATAAATASDAAVGGWLLGKQWREGPTYRFPMAAAAVVGRRKGGGGGPLLPCGDAYRHSRRHGGAAVSAALSPTLGAGPPSPRRAWSARAGVHGGADTPAPPRSAGWITASPSAGSVPASRGTPAVEDRKEKTAGVFRLPLIGVEVRSVCLELSLTWTELPSMCRNVAKCHIPVDFHSVTPKERGFPFQEHAIRARRPTCHAHTRVVF